MAETNDFAQTKLAIYGVLQKRNALEQSLGSRMANLIDIMEKTTIKYLHEVGRKVTEAAKANIDNSAASGRTYTYVEIEDGVVTKVGEHTSSESRDFPSSYSGKLKDSIEYKVRTSQMSVQVGVYSGELGGEWATKYYTKSMYVDNMNTRVPYVVVVDKLDGIKTPINKYAKYLTEGTEHMEPRPFLKPALESTLPELRKDMRKEMREEVQRKFRKKVKLHFRMVPKE